MNKAPRSLDAYSPMSRASLLVAPATLSRRVSACTSVSVGCNGWYGVTDDDVHNSRRLRGRSSFSLAPCLAATAWVLRHRRLCLARRASHTSRSGCAVLPTGAQTDVGSVDGGGDAFPELPNEFHSARGAPTVRLAAPSSCRRCASVVGRSTGYRSRQASRGTFRPQNVGRLQSPRSIRSRPTQQPLEHALPRGQAKQPGGLRSLRPGIPKFRAGVRARRLANESCRLSVPVPTASMQSPTEESVTFDPSRRSPAT